MSQSTHSDNNMTEASKTENCGLFWFRHDLRVTDNEPLNTLARDVNCLLCVFVVDSRWFKASHYQSAHMGEHRWRFLMESLVDLDEQLKQRGQQLIVKYGEPIAAIGDLVIEHNIKHIACNYHSGVYECQQWQRLQTQFPFMKATTGESHSLFTNSQLPFALTDLPDTFTPFRKKVEMIDIDQPMQAMDVYPPTPIRFQESWPTSLPQVVASDAYPRLLGGASAAKSQLKYYLFETDYIAEYKQTRNGLDGWSFSSKLSAWLANGSISARQVFHELKRYEAERTANASTYWLYFELLWREYFYWYALKHNSQLFKVEGVRRKRPLTTFAPQRFAKWTSGTTPYPIVNACMRQLNATGFMSNRGRQLVASCLVHELSLDWRYGAAYFEQQLIDFDVASNWGNWQYLAGVGADPRGHRQFNLQKQTQMYDPNERFIEKWQGHSNTGPLDDVDYADWPISWQ
ncbi:MAG: DASH family cryptochrome [Pseudomonadota bacterium]